MNKAEFKNKGGGNKIYVRFFFNYCDTFILIYVLITSSNKLIENV